MSFILFVLAAGVSATSLEGSRDAYNECLSKITFDMLTEGKTSDEFSEASKTACEPEKANFRAAVIKDERAAGSTAAEAGEFADEEVVTVLDDFALGYADHLEFKTKPILKE